MRSLNGLRFLVGVAVLGPQNEGNGEWQRQLFELLASSREARLLVDVVACWERERMPDERHRSALLARTSVL